MVTQDDGHLSWLHRISILLLALLPYLRTLLVGSRKTRVDNRKHFVEFLLTEAIKRLPWAVSRDWARAASACEQISRQCLLGQ